MGFKMAETRVACSTNPTTQDITISGFGTPVAAIFIPVAADSDGAARDNSVIGIGYTDGTRNRALSFEDEHLQGTTDPGSSQSTTACVQILDGTGGNIQDGVAAFSAWITDGVRINWSNAPTNAYLMTVILIGGTDASVYVGSIALGTTQDSSVDVTDPGFEPDIVMGGPNLANAFSFGFIHNDRAGGIQQMSLCHTPRSGRPSSEHNFTVRSDYGLIAASAVNSISYAGEFGSFDSSGFSITTRLGGTSNTFYYIAIRTGSSPVVDSKVYLYSTPTGTGSADDTGAGFKPQFMLYLTGLAEAVSTIYTDSLASSFGLATITAASQHHQTVSQEDNLGDTNTQSLSDDQAVNLPLANGGAGMAATFSAFISTGVTLSWSDVESAAKKWIVLAVEEEATGTTVTPTSAACIASTTAPTAVRGSLSPTPTGASAVAKTTAPSAVLGALSLTPGGAACVVSITGPADVAGSLALAPGGASAIARVTDPSVGMSSQAVTPTGASAAARVTDPADVAGSLTLTPAGAVAVARVVDPTVEEGGGGDLVITPTIAAAVARITSPAVVLSNLVVSPVGASAVAKTTDPAAVAGSLSLSPSGAVTVAGVIAPTVIEGSVTVTPVIAAVTATVINPAIILNSLLVTPTGASAIAKVTDPIVLAALIVFNVYEFDLIIRRNQDLGDLFIQRVEAFDANIRREEDF